MIRNLTDLAQHLGVERSDLDGDLAQRIARRLYKRTECGIGFFYQAPSGGYLHENRPVRYFLRYQQGVAGWRLIGWREAGGRWRFDALPSRLAEYAEVEHVGWVDYDPATVPAPGAERKVTYSSADGSAFRVRLSVTVTEPRPTRRKDRGYIVLTGYCEGDVGDCPSQELAFPFTDEDFDRIVAAADQDGCDLWDETHGCPQCHGGEDYDEYGVNPVDPDCPACEGAGIIL